MKRNIVFFDEACPLCQSFVSFIHTKDKNKKLFYAPLEGETAKKKLSSKLSSLIRENTLVFLEENGKGKKIFIKAKAVSRVFWTIGGFWKVFAFISFLPFANLLYSFFAKRRYFFKGKFSLTSMQNSHFLP